MVFSNVNMEKTTHFNSIKAMIDARLCLFCLSIELEIKPAECPSELLTKLLSATRWRGRTGPSNLEKQ